MAGRYVVCLSEPTRNRTVAASENVVSVLPANGGGMADQYFLTEFDIFRLGNSSSPRLDHVRVPKDIATHFVGPIEHVQPGLAGVSMMNEEGLQKRMALARKAGSSVGHVWRISRATPLPHGLVLREDPRDRSHLLLCPAESMPLDKLRGLLLELAARCVYVGKR